MEHPIATTVLPAGPESIALAAQRLREGSLVAFPTETVYGLGADATSSAAVASVYGAKGRPAEDPLIVHVADRAAAEEFAELGPDSGPVCQLVAAFWPGPLTVVVPRRADAPGGRSIAPEVSQLDSIGLRCPAEPTALALIREAGVPVAAPSANRFGRISPTTAQHVVEELDGRVPVVLDGGPTRFGVESTVVAPRGDRVEVLRPGAVPLEALADVLGSERVDAPAHVVHRGSGGSESPGTTVSHYAPEVPVLLAGTRSVAGELARALEEEGVAVHELHLPAGGEAAPLLYGLLRDLDGRAREGAFQVVVVALVEPSGLGRAVNDRLLRAADGHLEVSAGPESLASVRSRLGI